MKIEETNPTPSLPSLEDSAEDCDDEEEVAKQEQPIPESKEFCSIKCPNGMKITLGSCKYDVMQLADASLFILKEHLSDKKEKGGKSYLG